VLVTPSQHPPSTRRRRHAGTTHPPAAAPAAVPTCRFMNKDYVLTRDLAADYPSDAGRVGIMFGKESSGLTNAEVALASKVLTVDSDPSFPVLNLAQALVVICYELYGAQQRAAGGEQQQGLAAGSAAQRPDLQNEKQLCTKGDVEGLLQHMYSELDAAGFFEAEHKRQSVQINIRNIFTRVDKLSKPEVQMLRGMISKLTGARKAAGGSRQQGGAEAAGASAAVDGTPDAAVVGEQ
jgi:tRNA/rRNA methyltransferase